MNTLVKLLVAVASAMAPASVAVAMPTLFAIGYQGSSSVNRRAKGANAAFRRAAAKARRMRRG